MFPELPDELKRFDSITDAYNGGDYEDLMEAIGSNLRDISSIISNLEAQHKRYKPQKFALSTYKAALVRYRQSLMVTVGHVNGPPPVSNIYEARAVILKQYKDLGIAAKALRIAAKWDDQYAERCIELAAQPAPDEDEEE